MTDIATETPGTSGADGADSIQVTTFADLFPEKVTVKEPEAPPGDAQDQGETVEGHSESSAEEQEQRRGPPKGVQKRIDELTREKHDYKRQLDQAMEVIQRLTGDPQEVRQPQQPQKPTATPGAPDPDQFEDGTADPAYLEALTDWKVEQRLQAREAERSAGEARARLQQAEAEFIKATPDYSEARATLEDDPVVWNSPVIGRAVQQSENPAAMMYELGKNPDLARQIAQMDPLSAGMALGEMRARLAKPAETPAPKAPEVSKAPAPITPLKGVGAAPDDSYLGRADLSQSEWEARRERDLAKQRRR